MVNENFNSYKTDFSLNDTWKIKSGTLTCINGQTDKIEENFLEDIYTDYTITVNAQWLGRAKNTGFGLIFGNKGNKYFIFRIAPDGHYQLLQYTGVSWNNIFKWTATDLISSGFNNLKVSCSGKNVRAYINNNLVINTSIENYEGGKVGLICSGNLDSAFDDFVISASVNGISENKASGASISSNNNKIVVYETFDGNETKLGLNEYWKLKNNMITCSNGESGKIHYTRMTTEYNDCSISVKARWDGRSNEKGFGIQFGKRDETFYIFRISPDGHYQLSYYNGTKWNDIVSWKKTDLIKSGFNNLKVICSQKNIRAYINNAMVININVDLFSGGKVGLACSGDVDASFDDFIVEELK